VIDFSKIEKRRTETYRFIFKRCTKTFATKTIVKELDVSRSHCQENLKLLEANGFIEKFQNEFGITLYRATVPTGTSTVLENRLTRELHYPAHHRPAYRLQYRYAVQQQRNNAAGNKGNQVRRFGDGECWSGGEGSQQRSSVEASRREQREVTVIARCRIM
jgi:hypothetical protein